MKYLLYIVGGLVALLLIAAVMFTLLFDPNDFRDNIAAGVKERTGRELVIEGDLNVSLFPWLAIDVGGTRLGNAEGFGDEPFASFERARLSVRVMPLLLRREILIGTAELESLVLNLQVKRDGRSNWQDLAERDEVAAEADAPAETPGALDIASLSLSNANIRYDDAQLGERYLLTDLNIRTGTVVAGEPVKLSGGFGFLVQPEDISGTLEFDSIVAFEPDTAEIRFTDLSIEGATDGETPMPFTFTAPVIRLQTEKSIAIMGSVNLSVFDVDIAADVETFSYADSLTPVATIQVEAFSPRSLMQRMEIDAPETADPGVLSKLIIDAKATVTDRSIRLTDLELTLDDTRLAGALTIPRNTGGTYQLDLSGNSIDLDRYMEPSDEGGGAGTGRDEAPVEIPVEIIRALNARGTLKLEEASLGGMRFDDVSLVVNSANGQMRLNPLSAKFFDGSYQGDIRINAAGNVAVLSVNEKIQNVSLGALAEAMLEGKDITGQINGAFRLEGRGRDMAEVQRTLKGDMSFVLTDGIWHGTDVWYELRRARARFRQETPPEPELPPQTRFSEVSATGVVTEGVMYNDDFIAELPFMRLTGRGTVDFPTASVDYSLSGRVLEKPELASTATPAELGDLTKAVIPIKITGPLAEPSFKIDFESLLRERVKEEVRDRVLDRLLGGKDKKQKPAEAGADGEKPAEAGEEVEKPAEAGEDIEKPAEAGEEGEAPAPEAQPDPEEELKDRLKELFE